MNPLYTNFQARLDAICAQQDYAWFVAVILSGGALFVWWRHPRRQIQLWIAWGAVTTLGQSMAALAAFLAPFNERNNPEPDAMPPHIASDLLMGGLGALLAATWIWQHTDSIRHSRAVRWTSIGVLVALCWLRLDYPVVVGWILVGTLALLLPFLVRRHGWSWLTISAMLVVAAAWLSPWGPVAAMANVLQRGREWSAPSVICPVLLSASQLAGLVGLLGDILNPLPQRLRNELWVSVRPFVFGAGAWLAAGLIMAAIAARSTRHAFEAAALSRVVTAAALFDSKGLPEALGGRFDPVPAGQFTSNAGMSVPLFRTQGTADANVEPAIALLYRLFELNLDLTYACIALPRAGEMFEAIPMRRPKDAGSWGTVYSLRRLTARDDERWSERTPHGEIGNTPSGTMFMARAPLLSAAGERLGWLQFDFCIPLWAAAQAQARLLAFAVVAMGFCLLSLLALRQWREREREAALRMASAAEEANRMKTTFLANVSHELRTPIQSILGYAELLQGNLRGEVERVRLAALRQHGELMIRLVNDLIDLGMFDSGAFRLIEKTFALKRLVTEVVESLAPRAEAKGLKLVCEIDEQVSLWVISDPERLRQVLLNLVGNAVKYTDRGRVDVLLTRRSEEGDCQYVDLVVRDTGPGIRPDERRLLFEPFSRLANAEHKEGAGLGLALTAGLCQRLGNGLAVESDGVSGSLFRTTLKLRVGAAPVEYRSVDSNALAGWRILVADDNALVRDLFVAYLSQLGAECHAAPDGEAAIALASVSPFHAVVLDLAMPGLDGNQVARRLRAAGGRQRIIGVSAHAGGLERSDALAAGMDDFLLKPIELPALAAALNPKAAQQPETDVWAQRQQQWSATLLRELPDSLAKLSQALELAAWPLLRQRAHYLKNSAMVVRDDELFTACGALELAASCEDLTAARTGLADCLRAVTRRQPANEEFRPHPRRLQPEPSTQP